jgi:hypothetical protein
MFHSKVQLLLLALLPPLNPLQVRIWDAKTQTCLVTLSGHSGGSHITPQEPHTTSAVNSSARCMFNNVVHCKCCPVLLKSA